MRMWTNHQSNQPYIRLNSSYLSYPLLSSHHITSHLISSHHITSHHITSHHITFHHITSHHITSHLRSSPILFSYQHSAPVSAMAQPDPSVATKPTHRSICLLKQKSPSSVEIVCSRSPILLLMDIGPLTKSGCGTGRSTPDPGVAGYTVSGPLFRSD
jgi:hypothetical protein